MIETEFMANGETNDLGLNEEILLLEDKK